MNFMLRMIDFKKVYSLKLIFLQIRTMDIIDHLANPVDEEVWDIERAFNHLHGLGEVNTKRTTERKLNSMGFFPAELNVDALRDEPGEKPNHITLGWHIEKARKQRKLIIFAQLHTLPNGHVFLHGNDPRGARYWCSLSLLDRTEIMNGLIKFKHHLKKDVVFIPHGALEGFLRNHENNGEIFIAQHIYPPTLKTSTGLGARTPLTPHLKHLEAESIHIIREAVAEAENPVMLYSLGKDSSVMLQLALKAFYPSKPPLALLHVDTRWKFKEMYLFRDHIAKNCGMNLLVHVNPEAIQKNINPFEHGSSLHTEITKTEGLKQALNEHGFDVIFGGARRDEEKSRAKERIFSFRTKQHRWDPKQQRPELWNLYNTRKSPGESIRVFPLSNWTEIDIWQYIHHEQIPVVPLYFAKKRPVVNRNGMLLMIDDDRFQLLPGEEILEKKVRFRTLGCYPLTGAIESNASNVSEIIVELVNSANSERQGRLIDTDSSSSMEKKKQEGYF